VGDGGEETVVEWVVLQACFCSMTRVESGDFGSMNKVACGVYMTVYASLSLLSRIFAVRDTWTVCGMIHASLCIYLPTGYE
jgi:hypothetical protein